MYPLLPLTSVFQTTLVCKFWPKEYFISKESCWKAWIHYSNFYDIKLKLKLFQQKTRETLTNCNLYNQTEFISEKVMETGTDSLFQSLCITQKYNHFRRKPQQTALISISMDHRNFNWKQWKLNLKDSRSILVIPHYKVTVWGKHGICKQYSFILFLQILVFDWQNSKRGSKQFHKILPPCNVNQILFQIFYQHIIQNVVSANNMILFFTVW